MFNMNHGYGGSNKVMIIKQEVVVEQFLGLTHIGKKSMRLLFDQE